MCPLQYENEHLLLNYRMYIIVFFLFTDQIGVDMYFAACHNLCDAIHFVLSVSNGDHNNWIIWKR